MKKGPLKIGITGGIGVGKSVVSRVFEVLKVPFYNADVQAKALMTSDPLLISQIKKLLGEKAYAGAQINRSYISKVVFNNQSLLLQLNNHVHPAVQKDFERWVNENSHSPYIVKEAALLFESGSYNSLDKIITVVSPLELRINRLKIRDPHRNEMEIKSIINKQLPEEEKKNRADFIIYNDEKQLIVPQVLHLHATFLKLHNIPY